MARSLILPPIYDTGQLVSIFKTTSEWRLPSHFVTKASRSRKLVAELRESGGLSPHHLFFIEHGAGSGGLTRALLQDRSDARVLSFEHDLRLHAPLKSLAVAAQGRLSVIHEDSTVADELAGVISAFPDLASASSAWDGLPSHNSACVICDLPYDATNAYLARASSIIEHRSGIYRLGRVPILAMLRADAAARVSARPGQDTVCAASWIFQNVYDVGQAARVPSSYYSPPMRIDNIAVLFSPRIAPLAYVPQHVIAAFAARALAGGPSVPLLAACRALGLPAAVWRALLESMDGLGAAPHAPVCALPPRAAARLAAAWYAAVIRFYAPSGRLAVAAPSEVADVLRTVPAGGAAAPTDDGDVAVVASAVSLMHPGRVGGADLVGGRPASGREHFAYAMRHDRLALAPLGAAAADGDSALLRDCSNEQLWREHAVATAAAKLRGASPTLWRLASTAAAASAAVGFPAVSVGALGPPQRPAALAQRLVRLPTDPHPASRSSEAEATTAAALFAPRAHPVVAPVAAGVSLPSVSGGSRRPLGVSGAWAIAAGGEAASRGGGDDVADLRAHYSQEIAGAGALVLPGAAADASDAVTADGHDGGRDAGHAPFAARVLRALTAGSPLPLAHRAAAAVAAAIAADDATGWVRSAAADEVGALGPHAAVLARPAGRTTEAAHDVAVVAAVASARPVTAVDCGPSGAQLVPAVDLVAGPLAPRRFGSTEELMRAWGHTLVAGGTRVAQAAVDGGYVAAMRWVQRVGREGTGFVREHERCFLPSWLRYYSARQLSAYERAVIMRAAARARGEMRAAGRAEVEAEKRRLTAATPADDGPADGDELGAMADGVPRYRVRPRRETVVGDDGMSDDELREFDASVASPYKGTAERAPHSGDLARTFARGARRWQADEWGDQGPGVGGIAEPLEMVRGQMRRGQRPGMVHLDASRGHLKEERLHQRAAAISRLLKGPLPHTANAARDPRENLQRQADGSAARFGVGAAGRDSGTHSHTPTGPNRRGKTTGAAAGGLSGSTVIPRRYRSPLADRTLGLSGSMSMLYGDSAR